MMEILASSILQTVIPELEYKHLCGNQRQYTSDEAILGFDWTPFQTTFKQATLGVDADLCKSFACYLCIDPRPIYSLIHPI